MAENEKRKELLKKVKEISKKSEIIPDSVVEDAQQMTTEQMENYVNTLYMTYKDEQKMEDLDTGKTSEEEETQEEKIEKIIFRCSALSSVIAIQPLPFADYFLFIPVHIYMIIKIGEIYGMEINADLAKATLFEILSILGYEYISRQLLMGLMKIGLPFLGGYIAIPISFSITYGLGKVTNLYFYHKTSEEEISNSSIIEKFKKERASATEMAKEQKNTIIHKGTEMKNKVYGFIKNFSK